jgi:hypothetical protein
MTFFLRSCILENRVRTRYVELDCRGGFVWPSFPARRRMTGDLFWLQFRVNTRDLRGCYRCIPYLLPWQRENAPRAVPVRDIDNANQYVKRAWQVSRFGWCQEGS